MMGMRTRKGLLLLGMLVGCGGGSQQMSTTDVPTAPPGVPAVARGGSYFGFTEQFNRYYTDPSWAPTKTVYVSATGTGDGNSYGSPAPVAATLAVTLPGTKVIFEKGSYPSACYEIADNGGSYDEPIVLYGERNGDGSLGVTISCCSTGRLSCFNLEAADYVAIDGFEVVGGKYGVRTVGADYAATLHQKGTAVLNCVGHDQTNDPFFSGQSDWAVWEKNVGYNAGTSDGHGMYLSNGSDWNIVRGNELYNNHSSDFQINADPLSTCNAPDTPDPDCDAVAGTPGDGGKGASDFMLVDGNYFHDGLAQGANFTSVRHSLVRNNIFAIYARHGTSFWQETANPALGSSDNIIEHNLWVSNNSNQMLQFIVNSDRNAVKNNLLIGTVPSAVWMQTDATVGNNVYDGNFYAQGSFDGRSGPTATETVRADFSTAWFVSFPTDWRPAAGAPWVGLGQVLPETPFDRAGTTRQSPTNLGPWGP
jgi:hypothetical protein